MAAMCGRFVSVTEPDGLVRFFTVDERKTDDLPPSWNVAPSQPVYAVAEHAGQRNLVRFQWGLVPHWAKDPKIGNKLINARVESLAEKPAFRDVFKRKRCLIPADGFYEWRRLGDKRKVPYFIHRADGEQLAFAGLWSAWRNPGVPEDAEGAWLRTCTIVTTDAGRRVRELHSRMPAMLPAESWEAWLDPELQDTAELRHLLELATDLPLVWHPVSTRVNTPANDDPSLIEPVPEPEAEPAQDANPG
jgi:putative SOS response-associated peptidase YedK